MASYSSFPERVSADSSPFFGFGFTDRRSSSHRSMSSSVRTSAWNNVLTVSWLGGMGTILYPSPTSHLPLTLCSYGIHSENRLTYSHTRSNLVWKRCTPYCDTRKPCLLMKS